MTACPTREQLYAAVVDAAEMCHQYADHNAEVSYRWALASYRMHRWECLTCNAIDAEVQELAEEAWK